MNCPWKTSGLCTDSHCTCWERNMTPNENNGLKPMCKKKKDAPMTFDPTQNRIPVALLTPEELKALKKWPHGHEEWDIWREIDDEWAPNSNPSWAGEHIYRGKPAPAVESKWFNVFPYENIRAHDSIKMADASAKCRTGVLRIDTINGVSTLHFWLTRDE